MPERTRRPREVTRLRTKLQQTDRELSPPRRESVSFEVICRPRSGAQLPQMMGELSLDTLEQHTPDERTIQDVAKRPLEVAMARSGRSKRKETASAQVFLRSISGRSLRESATGPPPADLAPFRAKEADRDRVFRHFQSLGFMVYRDELGLALTIEAPPSLFAKVFGTPADRLSSASAAETIRLRPPDELQGIIEEILVTPKPEFFQAG